MAKRRANGEGSIFQRKDGLWAAQYTDNTGKKRTLYGKTQQIVKNKLKEAIRESDSGMMVDKNKITFNAWMKEWLEVYVKPTRRKNTYAGYYCRIHDHIIPAFPKVLLKDVRTDMLQKFINEKGTGGRIDGKEGGLSTSVLHSMKMIISSALRQAEDNNLISINPAKKIKMPRKVRKDVSMLTREEQKKLEGSVMDSTSSISFAILLDLYTGLRLGELVALKLEDIDLAKKELRVRRSRSTVQISGTGKTEIIESEPKTAKGKRVIPLNDRIVKLLDKYIEERNATVEVMRSHWKSLGSTVWKDDGYLFLTRYGTVPEHTTMRDTLNRLLAKAEVKHIKFHALRHTFATRCIESGFDIRTLADILGHSDVSMTLNVYSHAMADHKRSNMEKLTMLFDSDKGEDNND